MTTNMGKEINKFKDFLKENSEEKFKSDSSSKLYLDEVKKQNILDDLKMIEKYVSILHNMIKKSQYLDDETKQNIFELKETSHQIYNQEMDKEFKRQKKDGKEFLSDSDVDDLINKIKHEKQPITIKSKKNELLYIKIYFDDKGRVDKIENKWDVKVPEWYGYNINEIEINNWINRKEPDLYIERNENISKNAFDDKIKYELKRYLEGTVYGKVSKTDERATKLMDIHRKFIDNVRNKMSANEIAKRLFEYEKNNLKR